MNKTTVLILSVITFSLLPQAQADANTKDSCVTLTPGSVYIFETCLALNDHSTSPSVLLNRFLFLVNGGGEISRVSRGKVDECVRMEKPISVSAPAYQVTSTARCISVTITKQ